MRSCRDALLVRAELLFGNRREGVSAVSEVRRERLDVVSISEVVLVRVFAVLLDHACEQALRSKS